MRCGVGYAANGLLGRTTDREGKISLRAYDSVNRPSQTSFGAMAAAHTVFERKPTRTYFGLVALGTSCSLAYIIVKTIIHLRRGATEVANRWLAVVDALYWIVLSVFVMILMWV